MTNTYLIHPQPDHQQLTALIDFINRKHLAIPVKFLLTSLRPFASGLESLSYMLEPVIVKPLLLVLKDENYRQLVDFLFVQDETGQKKINIRAVDLIIGRLEQS